MHQLEKERSRLRAHQRHEQDEDCRNRPYRAHAHRRGDLARGLRRLNENGGTDNRTHDHGGPVRQTCGTIEFRTIQRAT